MRWLVAISILISCTNGAKPTVPRSATPAAVDPVDPVDPRCVLPPDPTVLARDGNSILQRWDVPDDPVWFSPVVPDDPKYLAYRKAIRDANADLERPISDELSATTDEQREISRRDGLNADLAFGGGAGRVRPVRCLDAALFAYQHARYDELVHPTELVAMVLRKESGRSMLRIYFAASDVMFPPKAFYGLDAAKQDVADGWRLMVHLHNHTIQKRGDRPALGSPAPSTSDVQLLRSVAADLGLSSVWVTNGVYTVEVPASALARYHTRE